MTITQIDWKGPPRITSPPFKHLKLKGKKKNPKPPTNKPPLISKQQLNKHSEQKEKEVFSFPGQSKIEIVKIEILH